MSTGLATFGIEIISNHAQIEKIEGKWYLSFNIDFKIYGGLKTWRFDDIHANNCKIKIIGI